MDYLLPLFGEVGPTAQTVTESLPVYCEMDWDFTLDVPVVKDGAFVKVYGNDGIKVWIYKTLHVQRYRYPIYNWAFGHELEHVIGTHYSPSVITAEIERYLNECLTTNPYIIGVDCTSTTFKNGKLTIDANVKTIYGQIAIEKVGVYVEDK